MIPPIKPKDEAERLDSLKAYHLLKDLPEPVFQDVTNIAAEICGTPIALLNIITEKEQNTVAGVGLPTGSAKREDSFCAHTITNPREVLVVNDARFDNRFHDNPYTQADPPTVFYAGVPVLDRAGHALGALCVIDVKPKDLADEKIEALKGLARLIEAQLELRKTSIDIEQMKQELSEARLIVEDLMKKDGGNNSLQQLKEILDRMNPVLS